MVSEPCARSVCVSLSAFSFEFVSIPTLLLQYSTLLSCTIHVARLVDNEVVFCLSCVEADDEDEEETDALEAKLETEKAETMQKIKDINKLENRDKDLTLFEHGENIKNNQEKGNVVIRDLSEY